MEKVNILLIGKKDMGLKDEDIEVFTNLLSILDLYIEEEGPLINIYKNIFKENPSKNKMSLEKYNLNINYKKGNRYSNELSEYRYFSIERK